MDSTFIITLIGVLIGGMGSLVALILAPTNRKKIAAETAAQLAAVEVSRIKDQRELQSQISDVVKENERLREQREKDYVSREKERESKRKELDSLHEQLRTFQTQYIQMTDEMQFHRKNSTSNLEKLGDHIIRTGMLELQQVKDKQEISKLKDDILRLQTTTGQLLLKDTNEG